MFHTKLEEKNGTMKVLKLEILIVFFCGNLIIFFTEKGMFTMLDVVCVEERVFSCYD